MNISAWSIRRPIPSLVLFLVLMTLGLLSFRNMAITRFPNIDIPIVTIDITQSGAAPVELETQVTKRVEDSVAGVTNVKHIKSTITDGSSKTMIEFQLGTNTDRAVNDVKDAVSKVRQELPRTINEPIIQRLDVEGLPIVTYAASAPSMTLEELSWFIDDTVARKLQGVRGVAQVSRVGGVKREIRVSLNPERLLALGVTAGEVNRQLLATNTDLAGGRGEVGGAEQSIRALASASTVDAAGLDLDHDPRRTQGSPRPVGSGRATWPRKDARSPSLTARDVVAFTIVRAKGESDLSVAQRVSDALEKLGAAHPGVSFQKIDLSVDFTIGNYHSAMDTLLEGAILAILVVLLFLGDLRATIIAAIALPLSVFPTFWAMQAFGFSLNMVSLLAITLVTGILVDDAIVEIENIVRHMRMGKSAYRAALEAADEIGLAVIAITFTIVAVFAPVSFMGGIAGQYFRQFGLTVAAAVLISLLVARLITPMMAAYFLRPHNKTDRDGLIMRTYTRLIGWTVRHYYATLVLGFVVFALSIGSVFLLPSGFLPAEDAGRSIFALELPPGAQLGDTELIAEKAENVIRRRPEVLSVFIDGGRILGETGGAGEVRKATLTVHYTPREERDLTQTPDRANHQRGLEGHSRCSLLGRQENGQRTFTIEVTGTDNEKVIETAAQLTSESRTVPYLANVVDGAALDRPEIQITPRPVIAAELGVSTESLSDVIRIATLGDVDANLAKFNAPDRQVPIRVQLDEQARSSLQTLQNLKVKTGRGEAVPLITVADVKMGKGPSSIARYDRLRRVTIGADLVGTDALGQALSAVYELPDGQELASRRRHFASPAMSR